MALGHPFASIEANEQAKGVVESLLNSFLSWSFGRIDEFDSKTYSVAVRLLPTIGAGLPPDAKISEADLTGFMPLLTPWGGKDWGFKGGVIAQQSYCLVAFLGNPAQAAFALGPFFNFTSPAPSDAVEGGEFVFKHKSGSKIRMNNDASILLEHKSGAKIQLDPDGNIICETGGKAVVRSSNVLIGENPTLHVMLDTIIQLYNEHTHAGVQSGDSVTSPPVVPWTAQDATTDTKIS